MSSLDIYQQNIDSKVCHRILSSGYELKNQVKENKLGGVIIRGATESCYLVAKFNCTEPTDRVGPLDRLIAACAHYILKGNDVFDENFPVQEYEPGKRIMNSLAEGQAFPETTNLYYLYNSGLEHLVEYYPVMATALLEWREEHKEIAFKGNQGLIKKVKRDYENICLPQYRRLAEEEKMSLDELMVCLRNKIQDQGIADYLGQLKPSKFSSSHKRAAEFFDEMMRFFKTKQYGKS